MKLSEYIVSFLEKKTKTVFLLSGGGIMHLVDSLGQSGKIKLVCCPHEQIAAIAADAYGRMTNTPGVCVVTTGPGGTNALTGVAGAWLDSIPMVVIAGQVKTDNITPRKNGVPEVRAIGFQELNVIDCMRPVTKYAVTVTDPGRIRYELEKAWFMATERRPGPVFVEIPLDIQAKEIMPAKLPSFTPPKVRYRSGANPVQKILRTLKTAKRPLLMAGNGIRLSGAMKELSVFLKKSGIRAVTPMFTGDDLITDTYPGYAGRQGMWGNESANRALDTCDVLLVVGERLQLTQTSYEYRNFAAQATVIMADIDAGELAKKTIHVDIPVLSDAKHFLQRLNRDITKLAHWDSGSRNIDVSAYQGKKVFVNPYTAVAKMNTLMATYPHDVTTGDGMASVIPHQALNVPEGCRFLTNAGLGNMGSGLPYAVGASLSGMNRPVLCMEGDGSVLLNINALQILKDHTLPIKLCIWNNGGYYSIRNTHTAYFHRVVAADSASGVGSPDFSVLIPAWGIPYIRIRKNEDLNLLSGLFRSAGPVVCELMIDPDQKTIPKWTAGEFREN